LLLQEEPDPDNSNSYRQNEGQPLSSTLQVFELATPLDAVTFGQFDRAVNYGLSLAHESSLIASAHIGCWQRAANPRDRQYRARGGSIVRVA
jgi:hypothetical protein